MRLLSTRKDDVLKLLLTVSFSSIVGTACTTTEATKEQYAAFTPIVENQHFKTKKILRILKNSLTLA